MGPIRGQIPRVCTPKSVQKPAPEGFFIKSEALLTNLAYPTSRELVPASRFRTRGCMTPNGVQQSTLRSWASQRPQPAAKSATSMGLKANRYNILSMNKFENKFYRTVFGERFEKGPRNGEKGQMIIFPIRSCTLGPAGLSGPRKSALPGPTHDPPDDFFL